MFPGFVNIYRDDEQFVHLYFFPGISNNNMAIYKNIDLTSIPFTFDKSEDGIAIDYKFHNKSIVRIKCKLIERETNKIVKKILSVK